MDGMTDKQLNGFKLLSEQGLATSPMIGELAAEIVALHKDVIAARLFQEEDDANIAKLKEQVVELEKELNSYKSGWKH